MSEFYFTSTSEASLDLQKDIMQVYSRIADISYGSSSSITVNPSLDIIYLVMNPRYYWVFTTLYLAFAQRVKSVAIDPGDLKTSFQQLFDESILGYQPFQRLEELFVVTGGHGYECPGVLKIREEHRLEPEVSEAQAEVDKLHPTAHVSIVGRKVSSGGCIHIPNVKPHSQQ